MSRPVVYDEARMITPGSRVAVGDTVGIVKSVSSESVTLKSAIRGQRCFPVSDVVPVANVTYRGVCATCEVEMDVTLGDCRHPEQTADRFESPCVNCEAAAPILMLKL